MTEGIDFYFNEDGLMVFTAAYHLKRGYCCKNKCRHCPWNYGKPKQDTHPDKDAKIDE
ncbi:hypothetical protein SAMN03003324_01787 [Pedobacter antarcticus]|uniref:Uncharacterized protein n=1 Tax=Pedobacter antarcticus TaxID=34086 RepID=A0A1I2EG87_9SPHI|nr:DUF5522 domain-containing protein [Pedobacter antarcticus]SFE91488.1 hypothetical protein SAMN03003324_01787 [Pedobacter antarcticus]